MPCLLARSCCPASDGGILDIVTLLGHLCLELEAERSRRDASLDFVGQKLSVFRG